jgi:hypothetical protein
MDYSDGNSAALERASDLEKDPKGVVKRWLLELKLADKREKDWRLKGERVFNRYRQKDAKKHSFNILWANTETLRPAVYNSLPNPDVRRRYKDADPIGKACSEVISRSLEYGLDTTDFDATIKASVLDMLLPGRGVARVRYVPSLQQVGVTPETHLEENESHPNEAGEALEGDLEEVAWEQAPIEHVQWDDFRISAGKTWSEVSWIAFKHRLTRDELCEQFPECGEMVNLDNTDDEDLKSEKDEKVQDSFKTAEVWEVWDKEQTRVLFIAPGYKEEPLKVVDDPLNLQGFFPVPRPLYSIEDSSSLVPVPLYELYKEQAEELDQISTRINKLVKGLKLRGIYDSTLSELSELMRGEDNDLIPAANVTALLERGGLEKAIWFMPIDQAAMVLKELYVQREQCKAVIYEVTGISDILRGSTNASETATAQQIKSQWGSNRLKRMQSDVSRFIRDLIRLQAEIIGEKFQLETLQTMTGLKFPTMQDKQMAIFQAQQQGQQPPQMGPTWEEIVQIIRDDKQRTFKIDVETDSTIAASIESDMEGLTKVLGGVTQLIQGLGPAVQMGAMPIEALKELVLTIVRRSKMGNAVEDAFDNIKQPPPPPKPEQQQDNSLQVAQLNAQLKQAELQQSAQIEQQRNQMEAEREAQKQQMQAQIEQMKAQLEQTKAEQQAQIEMQRMEFDRWKAQLDAETKIVVAELQAKTQLKTQSMSINAANAESLMETDEEGTEKPSSALSELVEAINENMGALLQVQQQNHAEIVSNLSKPKQVIRGTDGRVVGVA